jgi:hypothetical protein
MAKKLFVRFSTSQDEEAIFDFYNDNKHEFVFQRDPEVWKERISSGAVTMIHDEEGTIVASSISYPVMKTDKNGNDVHEWTEIGSTRVALDGIGLVKPLVSAQILRAYLLEPPNDRFALEILLGNEHSKYVFTKLGAAPFDIPAEMSEKVNATITSAKKPVEWFQMGVETIPGLAQNVLDGQKNPVLKNKKTGEEYELDFSRCILVSQFHDEVKALALEDFGDTQKPEPKHGIRGFRDKFQP